MGPPDKKATARMGAAASAQTKDDPAWIDNTDSGQKFARQAHRLAFQFFMPLPTARAVASLAYETRPAR